MTAVLTSPAVWLAVLGLVSTLLGMLAGKLHDTQAAKAAEEKRQVDDANASQAAAVKNAAEAQRVADAITREKAAEAGLILPVPPKIDTP